MAFKKFLTEENCQKFVVERLKGVKHVHYNPNSLTHHDSK